MDLILRILKNLKNGFFQKVEYVKIGGKNSIKVSEENMRLKDIDKD